MTDLLAAAERFSAGYPSVNEQCEADTLALANFATALLTNPEARAALEALSCDFLAGEAAERAYDEGLRKLGAAVLSALRE